MSELIHLGFIFDILSSFKSLSFNKGTCRTSPSRACSEQVVFEAHLLLPVAALESWTGPTLRHLSCVAGLSKAARVAHLKAISSMIFFQMCGATSQDIIYITLPLYHMSASLLGIGGCIQLGKISLTSA